MSANNQHRTRLPRNSFSEPDDLKELSNMMKDFEMENAAQIKVCTFHLSFY